MKKRLNSSSKRKWIINGLLGFGAVALLTTGFATWVIGANNTKTDLNNTNVTVDTAKRNNITLAVTLNASDNGIHVGENETSGSGNFMQIGDTMIIDGEEGPQEVPVKATDFTVNLDVTLTIGKDVEATPDTIKFDFKYTDESTESTVENDGTNNNKVTVTSSNANAIHHEDDDVFTYIDIASGSTINVSELAKSENNDGTTYSVTNKEVTLFEWGTFFDKKAPSNFYNDLYDGKYKEESMAENTFYNRNISNTNTDVNDVYEELQALNAAFNKKTIVVTAEVTTIAAE